MEEDKKKYFVGDTIWHTPDMSENLQSHEPRQE
jgi:hypothetical protein